MLKKHFADAVVLNIGYPPTIQQEVISSKLSDFLIDQNPDEVFLLKGFAGTGKTTLLGAFVKALVTFKIESVLLAPTGRASKVLSSYTGSSAYTIHKKIYRQRSLKDGFGVFDLAKNMHRNTIFIVDEASMISTKSGDSSVFGTGNLLEDLLEYVYSGFNCRLVLTGDTAQLPPVGYDESPALEQTVLRNQGFSVKEHFLSEVIRQELDSGILNNAVHVREKIEHGFNLMPEIKTTGFKDIMRISGNELIEELESSFDRYGIEETIVICRSNKTANQYNKGIRSRILGREEEISKGDLLMVVKNNYHWTNTEELPFIANGDIAEISWIHGFENLYDFRFADVTLRFPDYKDQEIRLKILLDALDINSAALDQESNKKLFFNIMEDYSDLRTKKKKIEKVRENPYFNALQVKFAYAITCHKAQGGQWKNVFIDQGFLREDMINVEYLRWLYTAFTRASEKMYLVNFANTFFRKEGYKGS